MGKRSRAWRVKYRRWLDEVGFRFRLAFCVCSCVVVIPDFALPDGFFEDHILGLTLAVFVLHLFCGARHQDMYSLLGGLSSLARGSAQTDEQYQCCWYELRSRVYLRGHADADQYYVNDCTTMAN